MYTNRTLLAGATDLDPDLRAPIQQMIDFMAARPRCASMARSRLRSW
ncbi:putative S-adenosyl-L-methionine-dependent methyltransferase [Mycobacterium tuberculosis]|uniref:Putative S-adenosyl-L-methionine-dependent methyltransferase n=1 Tax=Mycobacterium tuberculosis TaxID=1773 RepID=A0A655AT93_MYCTX|nr:putative S-adenosyl-L-methionine-dependent methyltransferase [Mycobacterium tuberculosis]